ncbi:MAG: dephospho-CoA kinase, partial [Ilumatobacter sp.]
MLLVGLTGGIGAGKSTVSALLAGHGAEIIDADAIVRELQQPGSPVLSAMVERFGAHIISDDGSLDRAAVAAVVFGDSDEARAARADLNGIVHPALQSEIRRRIDDLRSSDRVVVLDFPLLAENPRDDLDATIVVDVDAETAVERLVSARGMDADDARRRIASQIDREQRRAIATHVLDNSGDLEALVS